MEVAALKEQLEGSGSGGGEAARRRNWGRG